VVKTSGGQGEQTVDVREGEQKDVKVSVSSASESTPTAPSTTPSEGPEAQATPAPEHPSETGNEETSHSPDVLTYIGIGTAGAGVIVGTITGILSMSKTSSLKTECPAKQCSSSSATSDYNSANTLATLSDVGFAVAGAGAALAVVSLIIGHPAEGTKSPETKPSPEGPPASDSPAPSSRIRVTPWIGFGQAGIAGRF
jgi:hypothetical protein